MFCEVENVESLGFARDTAWSRAGAQAMLSRRARLSGERWREIPICHSYHL